MVLHFTNWRICAIKPMAKTSQQCRKAISRREQGNLHTWALAKRVRGQSALDPLDDFVVGWLRFGWPRHFARNANGSNTIKPRSHKSQSTKLIHKPESKKNGGSLKQIAILSQVEHLPQQGQQTSEPLIFEQTRLNHMDHIPLLNPLCCSRLLCPFLIAVQSKAAPQIGPYKHLKQVT